MARLAPEEGFESLKEGLTAAVKDIFPIEGKKHTLRVSDVSILDNKDVEDLRSQKKAKMDGRTWAVPVEARLELVDNKTGKVIDRKKQRIAHLPKVTNRHSYIVDGNEYQLDNLWKLRPGAYSRVNQRGEFETMFNLKGRSKFDVNFDPKTAKFVIKKGSSQVPLYPVLREMGVSDEQLEKSWGKQVLASNRVKDTAPALAQFHRAVTKNKPESSEQARQFLHEFMDGAEMDPEVSEITLGSPYKTVTGDSIVSASGKLLGISRGDMKPDARDSLMFKTLHSAEDHLTENLRQRSREVVRRVGNNLNRKSKIQDILGPDILNRPIKEVFTKTSLGNTPDQTNPVEMIGGAMKTTIMGDLGGITSEHKITQEAKLIDPSHLGFLDPIHTPEGGKTGVTLHLPLGATKKGNRVLVKMWNTKTGKMEDVDPAKAYHSNIVLPDQVKWEDGKPVPRGKTVKLSGPENDIVDGTLEDADYVMAAPAQMFSVASNLIPFMQNDSANRSTMAGRHMEQAIPLKHREKPLVETSISEGRKKETSLGKFMGQISSQRAPVTGEVVKISKDGIIVKGDDGKKKEVQIYDNFPLNDDKGFIHSTPTVKVGDKVKAGQTVADTNFTRDGELALGTNLKAAYMPFKGYNFEDGVVISESAAKKLTSEHMHRKGVDLTQEHTLSKKKFMAEFGHEMTKDQADKLDDDGVVKPGQPIKPGDTLVAALRTREHTDETRMMAKMHKSLVRPHDDVSIKWEADHPGVVTNVVKRGSRAEVHVKTEEPAEIGDKLAGRHGNKGIITRIIPDHEMPQTKDGKSTEILLNPAGIPGRLNLGQVLETAAGKIAEKTGKRYRTQNFDGSEDQTEKVRKELKAAGIEDKEEVIDPKTKKSIGKVLVGPHYIHKLKHQVDKKLIARAGGPGYAYDVNRIPKGGGPHGAQALDTLGAYAMLAHGAKANIREMQTYKSNAENNDELWSAVQSGELLPPPQPTFAYKKFVGMLKAIGLNTVKEGSKISLQPLTDKQVVELSSGEIKDGGRMIKSKDLSEEKNGLFDKKVTGGINGTKWSHISLPEAMPNPIFEKAISSLTGIKEKDFGRLMSGERSYDMKTGKLVAPEDGISGNKAVGRLLSKIDVKSDLAAAEEKLKDPKLKGTNLNAVHRKVKFLRALDKIGMSPEEAYMQRKVAVMPPAMRPLAVSPTGSLVVDDANGTYKGLAMASDQLKTAPKALPDDMNNDKRAAVYDAMKALAGLGTQPKQEYRGILDVIRGKTVKEGQKVGSPREGFFQSKLIKRKQDLSMRSTIIPEPELGLDQVGIPRKAAMELYKPFVVKELRSFASMSPLQAQQAIKENDPLAKRALERVAEQRPVLLKRDPVLHKYGIQAFKPVLTGGKAVKIHPLVTSGYNADFDGDSMSAFVPLSNEAVDEAYKMMPSRNLFSPVTGKIMYSPTYESQLGLHTLTQEGRATKNSFKTIADAAKAAQSGKVGMTDIVSVGRQKTTVGRALVANALPSNLRGDVTSGKLELDGKGQKELLTRLARNNKDQYGEVVNKLKDLGNQYATYSPVSIGLDDIKADKKTRDRILSAADRKVSEIMRGSGKLEDKKKRAVQVYDQASESMIKSVEKSKSADKGALMTMMKAGVKPNMDAYRQIKMAPMLMMNAKGEVIPTPVRRSYSEGLDVGDYWTQMSGARKGVVQKVQSVQEPGYLTKQVMNSVMNNSVGTADCKTSKGISLPVDEKDILDRYLASDIKAGKHVFKSGTLITPGVRDSLRNNKVGRVVVRSPLRCEHGTGICAKCYGLDEEGKDPQVGLNVGVISGQAIGERATQLAMRTFHSGGIAPVGKKGKEQARLTDDFKRVQQIVQMYDKIPGSATLSTSSGKVEKIKKNPAGGMDVFIGGKKHYVPQNRGEPIAFVAGKPRRLRPGMPVQKGTPISAGPVNPHEMLPLAGVNKVQGYMAGQLYDLYKGEGIRRRNVETVVKSLTNLTRVKDPGDHKEFVRNDFAPTSYVQATNKQLTSMGKKPIRHSPVLKGVKTLPLDVQTDWLARLNHEKQTQTIVDAAGQGWSSDIHGTHPIPGMVYGAEFGRGTPY
jgi:DNA-directed RNA polymerase subunit beta'